MILSRIYHGFIYAIDVVTCLLLLMISRLIYDTTVVLRHAPDYLRSRLYAMAAYSHAPHSLPLFNITLRCRILMLTLHIVD